MKSKILNISSALLIIIGAWATFEGLWALLLSAGYLDAWMKMYGATIPLRRKLYKLTYFRNKYI